jgi:hypothetical protein
LAFPNRRLSFDERSEEQDNVEKVQSQILFAIALFPPTPQRIDIKNLDDLFFFVMFAKRLTQNKLLEYGKEHHLFDSVFLRVSVGHCRSCPAKTQSVG